MANNIEDNFFTPKHKRLTQAAAVASSLAWALLIFYFLYAGLRLFEIPFNAVVDSRQSFDYIQNFLLIFNNNPMYILMSLGSVLQLLSIGVFYYLVLKGVALGLNMIVDTDLNYRARAQEAETND